MHWRDYLGRLSFPLIPSDITEPYHLILTNIFQELGFTLDHPPEFCPLFRTSLFKLVVQPKHESRPARLRRKGGTIFHIQSQPVIEAVAYELLGRNLWCGAVFSSIDSSEISRHRRDVVVGDPYHVDLKRGSQTVEVVE
jgi:hypothetical protein